MPFDLHILEDSRHGQVIQMIAAEQHITLEQAAKILLEEAAELHLKVQPRAVSGVPSNADYLQRLRERSATREEARLAAGDPLVSIRPATPDALIGFLANAPEVAEAIRDMAYERRAESYGA